MMTLSEAAKATGGRTSGNGTRFSGVSTDSRAIKAGELFVALRGERFDGHDFLAAVQSRGAAGAIVDRRYPGQYPLPVIIVGDTKLALGDLARGWRARFSPALVAVTGSNGKTTVKEMLASILRAYAGEAATLATTGNLNNDIGVPLTLLRMRAEHRCCAIELGMNHRGEIAYLARIVAPTVALVNNAQREHLEFMNSVDDVAAENASVYDALPADGVAVVNADDDHAAYFRSRAGKRRIVDFGLGAAAVSARYSAQQLSSELRLRIPGAEADAVLAIPGLHNVRNALAAAACAHAAGVPATAIGAGLTAFRPYTGRLQVKQAKSGATVIDDTYNANPDSVRAAIDVLATCAAPTVLVLGDMGEVGPQGPAFHREIGAYAREKGLSRLRAVGESSVRAVEGFGKGGEHFADVEALVRALMSSSGGRTVLVKGSRFMRMERVVAALTGARTEGAH
jgi:UDP-N-acetylmuramoyl-tripeptide--D-alanyl-D-alanine ligase